ncbi:MAG: COQ9 family protein [Pseudomonadota bacterium]
MTEATETAPETEPTPIETARASLLDAALIHVTFDGWSPAAWKAAVAESGVDPSLAAEACPRGALDLAVAFHKAGDARMVAAMGDADLEAMRYSERVAFGVRARLEAATRDREAVRRGATLFSLPHMAPEGSRLIWGTADAIWTTLGDTSNDLNWYTKRAILSGVYSSTLLFWLGDDTDGFQATWAFLDRRIDDVMRIEKVKGQIRKNPIGRAMMDLQDRAFSFVKAPGTGPRTDLPGYSGQP